MARQQCQYDSDNEAFFRAKKDGGVFETLFVIEKGIMDVYKHIMLTMLVMRD